MMTTEKSQRTCSNGHQYWKSSDCPVCPICEKNKSLGDDVLNKLAAPAKRALANAGIGPLSDFSKFTENEVADMHGIGPNALEKIKAAMAANGISFSK
ncbi:MAG: hypothetical protein IT258_07735 [Saprospiraceae bacterium]|nr:hypothetical protein [Saprospiraceae bacterium]